MDALDQASENYKMGETSTESAVRFQLAKPDQVTDKHIEENYDYVRKMDSVASIRGDEFKGDPKEMRSKHLRSSPGMLILDETLDCIQHIAQKIYNLLRHGFIFACNLPNKFLVVPEFPRSIRSDLLHDLVPGKEEDMILFQ